MNIKKSILAGNFVKHICKHSDTKICFTKTLAPLKLSGGCFGASLSLPPDKLHILPSPGRTISIPPCCLKANQK